MKSSTPTSLALEFSSKTGSIALMSSAGETITASITIGRREDDDIFPSIEKNAATLGISPRDITLVIVSIGPGGFTGLRTAVAIAKMIALVSGATIVPVESAIVTVQQANQGAGPFAVISSVKDDEFWFSNIVMTDDAWVCTSKLTTSNDLLRNLKGVVGVFADSYVPEEATGIIQQQNIPMYTSAPNAKALLQVGLELYTAGKSTEPASLLPLYPREPEAVRLWNARKSPESR